MRMLGFLDELVKLGAMRPLVKHGSATYDVADPKLPEYMAGSGAAPVAIRLDPAEAKTRLPLTAQLPRFNDPTEGTPPFGDIAEARHPIDEEKFNRVK